MSDTYIEDLDVGGVRYERDPPCDSYGDVDGDGVVSHQEGEMCDSLLVARYVAEWGWDRIKDDTSLTEAEFIERADVTASGEVNAGDAMLIGRYAAGEIDTFTVCTASDVCGDVTGNGVVDMGDVTLLLNHVVDPDAYPINSDWNGDVTGDGVVDMGDVALLQNHVGDPAAYPLKCKVSEPVGDITKVELDSKLLPEGGTLDWVLNDDADIKVYFKNTGTAAGTFDISVTDEGGATLCSVTTEEIAADGAEYYIDCGTFTPAVKETKTLTAHIDP